LKKTAGTVCDGDLRQVLYARSGLLREKGKRVRTDGEQRRAVDVEPAQPLPGLPGLRRATWLGCGEIKDLGFVVQHFPFQVKLRVESGGCGDRELDR
jgi:hypothetical protein